MAFRRKFRSKGRSRGGFKSRRRSRKSRSYFVSRGGIRL